jgi:hypothetical protein
MSQDEGAVISETAGQIVEHRLERLARLVRITLWG